MPRRANRRLVSLPLLRMLGNLKPVRLSGSPLAMMTRMSKALVVRDPSSCFLSYQINNSIFLGARATLSSGSNSIASSYSHAKGQSSIEPPSQAPSDCVQENNDLCFFKLYDERQEFAKRTQAERMGQEEFEPSNQVPRSHPSVAPIDSDSRGQETSRGNLGTGNTAQHSPNQPQAVTKKLRPLNRVKITVSRARSQRQGRGSSSAVSILANRHPDQLLPLDLSSQSKQVTMSSQDVRMVAHPGPSVEKTLNSDPPAAATSPTAIMVPVIVENPFYRHAKKDL